jgi:hypothetical protein
MNCQETTDWIWETARPDDPPTGRLTDHLRACTVCGGELEARLAVCARLRDLRGSQEEETPPGVDRMVLDAASAASSARESGDYGTLRAEAVDEFSEGMGATLTSEMNAMMSGEFAEFGDLGDIADEIAESIAEEYGAEIATLTTNRLKVADGPPPAVPPKSPRAERESMEARDETEQVGDTATSAVAVARDWAPPRASGSWMRSAAALLVAAASIGFLAGRFTAPPSPPATAVPPQIHTTIATGLSPRSDDAPTHPRAPRLGGLAAGSPSAGNTYVLTGPVGGPYEVVGIVGWDTVDAQLRTGPSNGSEIVIAVGPPGGWSRGTQLAVSELTTPGVEILERRPLP